MKSKLVRGAVALSTAGLLAAMAVPVMGFFELPEDLGDGIYVFNFKMAEVQNNVGASVCFFP